MDKYELHTSAGDLVVMNTNLSNMSITPDQRSELERIMNSCSIGFPLSSMDL